MADPIKYVPGYSFTDFQASNPSRPLPADEVDTELAKIKSSTGSIVDAVKDVRRSDCKLKNAIVTYDSLSADMRGRLASIGFVGTEEQIQAIVDAVAAGIASAALAEDGATDLLAFDSDGAFIRLPVISNTLNVFITSDHQIYNTDLQKGYLDAVLADIVSLKRHATFMIGDLVDNGDEPIAAPTSTQGFVWSDYFDKLYSAGVDMGSWYSIAGNHDVANLPAESPKTKSTVVNYLQRTRRPPVYALTCGNMAFIFCGYEGSSVEQVMSPMMMDQVEDFLKKFQHTHNIVLLTHAPLYEAGLFDFNPATDWFRLKPQTRWLSFFDTYPIDAHFCGHSATDIITADESDDGALRPGVGSPGGSWKTYATRTNGDGHTTHFFLTGPHIEQKHWNSNHKLGGRDMLLKRSENTMLVRMRDHLAVDWVEAKEKTVALRFPIRLGDKFEEWGGYSVSPYNPLLMAPLKIAIGRGEENQTGTGWVDARKTASEVEWVDQFQGDVPINAEMLHEMYMPRNDRTAKGGSVKFGARRMTETDEDMTTGFVVYGSGADGSEQAIIIPRLRGCYEMQGSRYVASRLYPLMQATFGGAPLNQADPLVISGFSETYDDMDQFDPGTGVFTCSHMGVYNFQGMALFSGHASAFEDIIQLRFKRNRAGVLTYYGIAEATLQATSANARQTINTPIAKIGLLDGDTVSLEVSGWAAANTQTITRAAMSAELVRSV